LGKKSKKNFLIHINILKVFFKDKVTILKNIFYIVWTLKIGIIKANFQYIFLNL